MRFRRWPRVTTYVDTTRKRAALARSLRLQREKLPLLADFIAARQPSEDEEMARRTGWWPRQQQEKRDERARAWRRARARLAAFDNQLRPTIIVLWRTCPYPADPRSVCSISCIRSRSAVSIRIGLLGSSTGRSMHRQRRTQRVLARRSARSAASRSAAARRPRRPTSSCSAAIWARASSSSPRGFASSSRTRVSTPRRTTA